MILQNMLILAQRRERLAWRNPTKSKDTLQRGRPHLPQAMKPPQIMGYQGSYLMLVTS